MIEKNKIINFSKIIILIFNLISIIIFATIAVLSTSDKFSFVSTNILSYILIGLQLLTLLLTSFYEKEVENAIFKSKKSDYIRTVIPIQKESETQIARNELRLGLNIIMSISIVITILLCIMLRSFLPFLASMCILVITYIYSDYLPHVITYTQKYDANFPNVKKGNSIRGLARIYLDEYIITKFKRKHFAYKNAWNYKYDRNSPHQDKCIKCILQMEADSIENSSKAYGLIVIAINILLVLPGVFEFIISEFIVNSSKTNEFIRLLIFLSINIFFLFFSIISVFTKENKEKKVFPATGIVSAEDSALTSAVAPMSASATQKLTCLFTPTRAELFVMRTRPFLTSSDHT